MSSSPSCLSFGEPGVASVGNSLCGRIIIACCQHKGATLDPLEEGLQLGNVWDRKALGREKRDLVGTSAWYLGEPPLGWWEIT